LRSDLVPQRAHLLRAGGAAADGAAADRQPGAGRVPVRRLRRDPARLRRPRGGAHAGRGPVPQGGGRRGGRPPRSATGRRRRGDGARGRRGGRGRGRVDRAAGGGGRRPPGGSVDRVRRAARALRRRRAADLRAGELPVRRVQTGGDRSRRRRVPGRRGGPGPAARPERGPRRRRGGGAQRRAPGHPPVAHPLRRRRRRGRRRAVNASQGVALWDEFIAGGVRDSRRLADIIGGQHLGQLDRPESRERLGEAAYLAFSIATQALLMGSEPLGRLALAMERLLEAILGGEVVGETAVPYLASAGNTMVQAFDLLASPDRSGARIEGVPLEAARYEIETLLPVPGQGPRGAADVPASALVRRGGAGSGSGSGSGAGPEPGAGSGAAGSGAGAGPAPGSAAAAPSGGAPGAG